MPSNNNKSDNGISKRSVSTKSTKSKLSLPKRLFRNRKLRKCIRWCKNSVIKNTFEGASLIISHIGLCTLVGMYAVFGAWLFQWVEGPEELKTLGHIRNDTENLSAEAQGVVLPPNGGELIYRCDTKAAFGLAGFSHNPPVVMFTAQLPISVAVFKIMWKLKATTAGMKVVSQKEWKNAAYEILREYEMLIIKAVNTEGYDGDDDLHQPQWTFYGALLYSITVFTTIGYGHISPKTREGRLLTIVYATVGIPLMLITLANIAESLAQLSSCIYFNICCAYCRYRKRVNQVNRAALSIRNANLLRTIHRTSHPRTGKPVMVRHPSAKSIRIRKSLGHTYIETSTIRPHKTKMEIPMEVRSMSTGMLGSHDHVDNISLPTYCKSQEAATLPYVERYVNRRRAVWLSSNPGSPRHTMSSKSSSRLSLSRQASMKAQNVTTKSKRTKAAKCCSCREDDPLNHRSSFMEKYAVPSTSGITAKMGGEAEVQLDVEVADSAQREDSKQRTNDDIIAKESTISMIQEITERLSSGPKQSVAVTPTRKTISYFEEVHFEGTPQQGFSSEHQSDEMSFHSLRDAVFRYKAHQRMPVSVGLISVCVFILIGSILFSVWEKWNFFDSAYFCFVTITTIGFGDLVPGSSRHSNNNLLACSLYLLIGMALIAMCFKLMQDDVIRFTRAIGQKIGLIAVDDFFDSDSETEINVAEHILAAFRSLPGTPAHEPKPANLMSRLSTSAAALDSPEEPIKD